jgi:NAD(P)-dependent dehydrogenase (short-subunit alcohol dehydrogenase family)
VSAQNAIPEHDNESSRDSFLRMKPNSHTIPSKKQTPCPLPLSGRNAVVVGASSGINLGVAHRLGSLGAKIAIVSRSRERSAAAADALPADGFDVTHHAGDVRDASAMQAIMTEVADATVPIDIVLSGAVIDIDLIGTFNVLSADC